MGRMPHLLLYGGGPSKEYWCMNPNERLVSLIEEELETLGFELVKLDSSSRGKRQILRIYIDNPAGKVTIDNCVAVSKALGFMLDGEDIMPGGYNLEVSTPGINRILTKQEHFTRFCGKEAKVEFLVSEGGKETVIGEIIEVRDNTIVLSVGSVEKNIEFDMIVKANLFGEKWGVEGKGRKSNKSRRRKK